MRYIILVLMWSSLLFAGEKTKTITDADKLTIREQQLKVLEITLRIQPLQIAYGDANNELQNAVITALKNAGYDPQKYHLDLDKWEVVENPKPPVGTVPIVPKEQRK